MSDVERLRQQLTQQEAENRRQRTTISELEKEAARAADLEEKVTDLSMRLEEAEKLTPDGAATRIRKLENEVLDQSNKVVQQGEKNMALQQDLESCRKALRAATADASKVRGSLVYHIAGKNASVDNFKNVSLDDMFRIYQKQVADGNSGSGGRGASRGASRSGSRGSRRGSPSPSPAPAPASQGSDAGAGSGAGAGAGAGGGGDGSGEQPQTQIHAVLAAEREIQTLKTRNRKLFDRVNELEEDLARATEVARNVRVAKAKLSEQAQRTRNEKAARERAENEVRRGMEKVEALMEHIEKLMVHLKHEAAAKAKAFDAQKRAEKDIKMLKNRNAVLAKKNHARDRLINELKEGAKILEDQLRLMDEKYIELRNKLDWTRQHSQKEVKRIQAQASRLRAQVMMSRTAFDMSSGGLSGDPATPGTAPGRSRRRGKKGKSGRLKASSSSASMKASQSTPALRDVRSMTMPLDPAADTDPNLPWSNTRLSQTYMSGQ